MAMTTNYDRNMQIARVMPYGLSIGSDLFLLVAGPPCLFARATLLTVAESVQPKSSTKVDQQNDVSIMSPVETLRTQFPALFQRFIGKVSSWPASMKRHRLCGLQAAL